ncbi:hypothetical protein K505DRAFT_362870 [Melanomma pulvis-pyrius CBS 109.77]|uniref:Rhodopsin domain-containing protein n=1 Tax=Melanomma pulvis-pyrius CBS 109.77 TaxID=1314802 RepID=A0A6A6X878_9PLEO|nr:hypothetical protein K505DRAFT_362870 [Melanomma pulvis-pyrius CBS 109.77]
MDDTMTKAPGGDVDFDIFPPPHATAPTGDSQTFQCDCSSAANGVLISAIVVLTTVNIVRAISVRIQRKGWELDNIAAHTSYVLSVAMMVVGLIWSAEGGTNDFQTPPLRLTTERYLPFLGLYYAAILSIKLSLLLFYVRIFTIPCQSLRIRLGGVFGTLIVVNGIVLLIWTGIVYMFFASTAVFWSDALRAEPNEAFIIRLNSAGFQAIGIGNAMTDLLLLVLAIWGVWHTQLPLKKKQKASILLLLGLLATIASVFRACQANLNQSAWGAAYQNVAHLTAITSETTLGFLCLCLPALNDVLINKGYLRRWYNAVKDSWFCGAWKHPFHRLSSKSTLPTTRSANGSHEPTATMSLVDMLSESPEKIQKHGD